MYSRAKVCNGCAGLLCNSAVWQTHTCSWLSILLFETGTHTHTTNTVEEEVKSKRHAEEIVMRGGEVLDPLRVRSLGLRKRSLLRKYAAAASVDETLMESTTAHRYMQFVKKPKKKRGRRSLRFAPLVDVYEIELPEDFTQEEFDALWISREDYEDAKKDFTDVIMIMQSDVMDSADLLIDENELPPDHALNKYCLRGCEKYFDLPTRFRVRQVVSDQVLEYYQEHPNDPEALRRFAQCLTAECSDLAFYHGKLNALQCWGTLLQRYQQLKMGLSLQVFNHSLSSTFSSDEYDAACTTNDYTPPSCGVEIILDPSAKTGSRALSVDL